MKLNRMPPLIFRAALVLLCLVVLTSGMTGRLFAKYYAAASGSDSARVARFSGGGVTYEKFDPKGDITAEYGEAQYYVFEANFTVTFGEAEVSRQFDFNTYFDGNAAVNTSLVCPADSSSVKFITINDEGTAVDGSLAVFGGTGAFTQNTVYYSVNDVWSSQTEKDDIAFFNDENIPMAGKSYDITILFFVKGYTENNSTEDIRLEEDIPITYQLECWQVD